MWPRLFEVNGVVAHAYGLFVLLTFLAFFGAMVLLLRVRQVDLSPAADLAALKVAAYLFIAKILWLAMSGDFTLTPERLCGGVWGGQIALALVGVAYVVRSRAGRATADAFAVAWAFSVIFNKLGCFMAGC